MAAVVVLTPGAPLSEEPLRGDASGAIRALRAVGIDRVVVATGDRWARPGRVPVRRRRGAEFLAPAEESRRLPLVGHGPGSCRTRCAAV